jgi:hypothetical protein
MLDKGQGEVDVNTIKYFYKDMYILFYFIGSQLIGCYMIQVDIQGCTKNLEYNKWKSGGL